MPAEPATTATPPTVRRVRRWTLVAIAAILLIAIGTFIAWQYALVNLRARVVHAIGTQGDVGDIHLSLTQIEITGLKLNAPAGWPVRHMLTAARVTITPDLGSLTAGLFQIGRAHV